MRRIVVGRAPVLRLQQHAAAGATMAWWLPRRWCAVASNVTRSTAIPHAAVVPHAVSAPRDTAAFANRAEPSDPAASTVEARRVAPAADAVFSFDASSSTAADANASPRTAEVEAPPSGKVENNQDVMENPGPANSTTVDAGDKKPQQEETEASAKKKKHSIRALIREHGLPLALYYLVLSTSLEWTLAYLLHFDVLGTGDVSALLKTLGLQSYFDVDHIMGHSVEFCGFTMSAKLFSNLAVADCLVTGITPFIMAFCVLTLGSVRSLCRILLRRGGAKTVTPPPAPSAPPVAPTASAPSPPASSPP